MVSRFERAVAEEECKTCDLPFAQDVPQYYIPTSLTSLPKPVWTGGGGGGLLPGLCFAFLFKLSAVLLLFFFCLFGRWRGGGGGG